MRWLGRGKASFPLILPSLKVFFSFLDGLLEASVPLVVKVCGQKGAHGPETEPHAARLGLGAQNTTSHAKMGSIKDRKGLDLTEAEDIKRGGKNTQKNCIKKGFTSQIIMMV